MYHNHKDKDYSFPWYDEARLSQPSESLGKWCNENKAVLLLMPFVGWALYLSGMPDGCHYFPFAKDRMWRESPPSEVYRYAISMGAVVACAGVIIHLCNYNLMNFLFYYGASWIMFGWWLVTVTYLQHHSPNTLSFKEGDWKFVDAAFETVDRSYGFGLDTLHHHITDCHVVHHLFFTKIPHYNLPIATKALKNYLKENDVFQIYRYEDTSDYIIRVYKYLLQYGFLSTVAQINEEKSK